MSSSRLVTARRWLELLIPTAGLCVLWGCCGGTTTYRSSDYQGNDPGYETDRGRAYLVMASSATTTDTGGMDSLKVRDAPYTLHVGFDTTGEYTEPVRVLSAKFVHQGNVIVIHDPSANPLEDPLTFDEGRGKQVARIEMPLGDTLAFVEGSEVEVTVVVDLPWESEDVILEETFVGNHSESSGNLIDGWMGI